MTEPARVPENERERLVALRSYRILDTGPEERFDRLTRLAARLFGKEIALVSLVDEARQWFKSKHGLEASEMPREIAFCAHAILEPDRSGRSNPTSGDRLDAQDDIKDDFNGDFDPRNPGTFRLSFPVVPRGRHDVQIGSRSMVSALSPGFHPGRCTSFR